MSHSELPPELPPGRYRHYKGAEYTVLACARHSETEAWHVLYRAEYGERGLWIRPLTMFCEKVLVNGSWQPRFTRIDESPSWPPSPFPEA